MTTTRPLQLLAFLLVLSGGIGAQAAPPAATPEQVARGFYDAFCGHDPDRYERLYAEDVTFQDEIFSFKDRAGTMGMWRAILGPTSDAKVTYELLSVDGEVTTVLWKADYSLIPGRPIHNEITSRMTIRDGKIVDHRDSFDWAKWSRQAFPLGALPTWKPLEKTIKYLLRTAIAYQARKNGQPAPTKGIKDRLPTK